eukprot:SAG25_NODE_254_length_10958_cov_53.133622_2_plen_108_part_00
MAPNRFFPPNQPSTLHTMSSNQPKYDSLRLEERDNSGHLALRVMHEVAQERRLFHWIHDYEENVALHNRLGLHTALSLRIEQRTTREACRWPPGASGRVRNGGSHYQ